MGPTFEDLAINVNQDISNIAYIFVGRAAGYSGGSLFGGILFEYLNPHLLLGETILYLETPVVVSDPLTLTLNSLITTVCDMVLLFKTFLY